MIYLGRKENNNSQRKIIMNNQQEFLTVTELIDMIKTRKISIYVWVKIFNDTGEYMKVTKKAALDILENYDISVLTKITTACFNRVANAIYIN